MRATEKTHFDLKRLHVWMAVASLLLLAVSVWAIVADHRRPWKRYQTAFHDQVEPWMRDAQAAQDRARTLLDEDNPALRAELSKSPELQRPGLAERLLRAPLLDLFIPRPAVEQIWLPELTRDLHFRKVDRFDRCVTCHQGIDKARQSRADQPLLPPRGVIHVELPPPKVSADIATSDAAYGLVLSPQDAQGEPLPTVRLVLPQTPAAEAKLQPGDVIVRIGDEPAVDLESLRQRLAETAEKGEPVWLEVRRGVAMPLASHSRLDLFVGPSSPHPMGEFGCTVCHEGQGSATAFRWASHSPDSLEAAARWQRQYDWSRTPQWDHPMLPGRFAESRCVRCHHEVTDLAPSPRFPDAPAAKLVAGYNLVREHGCFGCHAIQGFDASGRSVGPDLRLEPSGEQPASSTPPGAMRKVGPSLRESPALLATEYLIDRTAEPSRFRPESRMPRLFGLAEHLDESTRDEAERFEAVELQAIAAYLQSAAEPIDLEAGRPAAPVAAPSSQRGKRLFERQGCLACHKHEAFPAGRGTQGPDLSRLGAKYATADGRRWLESWLRDPVRHAPRTRMPKPFLEPDSLQPMGDTSTEENAASTDPTSDVAAFLLASSQPIEWPEPAAVAEVDLDRLVLAHLMASLPEELAKTCLREGVPDDLGKQPGQNDLAMLAGPMTREKKLRYLGRRTIRKRGCYGCHDTAGFDDTTLIGPKLGDWGRKHESLLAFEQVDEHLKRSKAAKAEPDYGFYLDAVEDHRREGFLWQKLRRPRSFDYRLAAEKPFSQWLTMGRFDLTPDEREAIMTFVLGLVADPPAARYVPRLDGGRRAIAEGRKVLDDFACAECHTLEMPRWTFEHEPDWFDPPPKLPRFDFLRPTLPPEQIAASMKRDLRGLRTAEVTGMPRRDASGRLLEDEDDDGHPLYFFTLWQPAAIDGHVWPVGGLEVPIAAPQLVRTREPLGGTLARLLYPRVLQAAWDAGATAVGPEAWGWLPPPLVGEGAKVRAAWLHDYLLSPTRVRPASIMRMPQYNLSPAEARKLVDYFAAVAEGEAPLAGREPDLSAAGGNPTERRDQAMRLLADRRTFCAKCHLIGETGPGGEIRTVLAPDLELAGERLRADYLRRWIGDPKTVLPYTTMPVNFPPAAPPLGQDLLPGTSRRQLDAVVDLLIHYSEYLRRKVSVKALTEQPE